MNAETEDEELLLLRIKALKTTPRAHYNKTGNDVAAEIKQPLNLLEDTPNISDNDNDDALREAALKTLTKIENIYDDVASSDEIEDLVLLREKALKTISKKCAESDDQTKNKEPESIPSFTSNLEITKEKINQEKALEILSPLKNVITLDNGSINHNKMQIRFETIRQSEKRKFNKFDDGFSVRSNTHSNQLKDDDEISLCASDEEVDETIFSIEQKKENELKFQCPDSTVDDERESIKNISTKNKTSNGELSSVLNTEYASDILNDKVDNLKIDSNKSCLKSNNSTQSCTDDTSKVPVAKVIVDSSTNLTSDTDIDLSINETAFRNTGKIINETGSALLNKDVNKMEEPVVSPDFGCSPIEQSYSGETMSKGEIHCELSSLSNSLFLNCEPGPSGLAKQNIIIDYQNTDSNDSITEIKPSSEKIIPTLIELSSDEEHNESLKPLRSSKQKHQRDSAIRQSLKKQGDTLRDDLKDVTCSVCLGPFVNRSFLNECFHSFCYLCITQWSELSRLCPLCKTKYASLIHSVAKDLSYEQYYFQDDIPDQSSARLSRSNVFSDTMDDARRFRYRSTVTSQETWAQRRAEREQAEQERLNQRQQRKMNRRLKWSATKDRRKAVYRLDMKVTEVKQRGVPKYRTITPQFFEDNPALKHRLVPWLLRDLNVLLGDDDDGIRFVMSMILNMISSVSMEDETFTNELKPFLFNETEHFTAELISFARSPYDIRGYDDNVVYDVPAKKTTESVIEIVTSPAVSSSIDLSFRDHLHENVLDLTAEDPEEIPISSDTKKHSPDNLQHELNDDDVIFVGNKGEVTSDHECESVTFVHQDERHDEDKSETKNASSENEETDTHLDKKEKKKKKKSKKRRKKAKNEYERDEISHKKKKRRKEKDHSLGDDNNESENEYSTDTKGLSEKSKHHKSKKKMKNRHHHTRHHHGDTLTDDDASKERSRRKKKKRKHESSNKTNVDSSLKHSSHKKDIKRKRRRNSSTSSSSDNEKEIARRLSVLKERYRKRNEDELAHSKYNASSSEEKNNADTTISGDVRKRKSESPQPRSESPSIKRRKTSESSMPQMKHKKKNKKKHKKNSKKKKHKSRRYSGNPMKQECSDWDSCAELSSRLKEYLKSYKPNEKFDLIKDGDEYKTRAEVVHELLRIEKVITQRKEKQVEKKNMLTRAAADSTVSDVDEISIDINKNSEIPKSDKSYRVLIKELQDIEGKINSCRKYFAE